MKQLLLAIALSAASFAALFSQDCSLPAANYCLDAKFICGYALQGYQGNNAGYQPAPDIPGFGLCGSFHNPQFFQIVPCDEQFSLIVQSSNCLKGDGLQVALAESCDGPVISCDGGFSGGAGFPLWLGANVIPGEPYVLIIDGYLGDECDFIIQDVQGVDLTPPNNVGVAQPGSITFQPFGCGGGMLSVKLPTCLQNSSQGCEQGWAGFYQNNCWQLNWNLPAGTEIVSPNPNAFTITVQFNQPVVNGAVSVSFDHLCPGINPGECSECIPGCCGALPSIIISSPPPCLSGPPNCQNFNLPAPLADSCHLAPYFSGGCLDGYCSTTAGLTPDQPTTTTDTIPEFENNGWLRVAPCKDSIAIDFQVFDCQTGDELGFFLLSGSCDTMTLLSFISAKDGETAHLTVNNLTPGEVYFLAIDGFYNAECKFQAHVLEGFGIEPDTATCSNCTPSVIDGPDDLCPGDFATYTFTPGGCDITFSGGNGQLCTPPDVCQLQPDTLLLHWSIPPFMNFVGDSVGVFSITVQVDTNLIGIDTVLTGQVNAFWAPASTGGGGGGNGIGNDNTFCGCTYLIGPCTFPIIPKDVTVHHDVETDYCEMTCVQPCCSYGGQSYCSPGTYIVSQTNCETQKLIVTSNIALPFADAGPIGVITCVNPTATLVGNSSTGPNFTYAWSGPGIPPFNQNLQNITVALPGLYTLVVTNTATGCTASDNVVVTMDITPPTVTIPPVPKVCFGDEVTLAAIASPSFAQYAWSNGMTGQQITFYPNANSSYTVTVTNLSNGCTKTATTTVQVLPPLITYLSPQTICEGDCVNVAGEEFCSGGNFVVVAESYLGCDSLISFVIIVKPYVVTNHGTVGTLTCDVTSISFMGNNYDQPGTYTLPDPNGCGEHSFTIFWNKNQPYLEVSPPQEICLGDTVALTVTSTPADVEFFWSNSSNASQIEVSPTVTTTYSVVAQDVDNGCASAAQVTVTVNPPTDTDLGVAGMLSCNQTEINFLGNTYSQPGQYSVPKPDGCGNNLFVILADITPPWCPMIPIPPICAGESITLQTAPPIPSDLQYLWSTGDTTEQISVTPFVTTNYTLTATNPANGCSSIVTTTVVVNELQLVQLGQVGTLTCAQPCLTFNGTEYCQPGTYSFTENCEIKEFQIGQDLTLPTIQLGQVGTLTCAQPCLTFNGTEYCQPGTYSVTENCEIKEFQIGQDLSLPTVQLGQVGTLTCAQPCLTFNGTEYCQPGTYSVTENCEIKEFQIGQDLSLPTVQLGQVGTLTCAQPCFTFNGTEYCQPGTYSVTENCEIKEFQIGQDLTLPTVQLGQVGTLTCAQPCFTFNGTEYCQPGTYSVTENCEIKEFQIGQDLSLQTVQLGQVGVLTCAQPCFIFNGTEYCQPGTYSVTENCEIKEFEVGVLPPVWLELGEDQTIAAGESAELQAQTNAQPAVITWHNPTGPMPEANLGITVQPAENTLYSLEIQDVNGCLLEDSVWVLVKKAAGEWFAPNVIKPGAAGLNGWFTLFASPGHIAEIQLLEIYDRWGNLVFTRKNFSPNAPEMGWDGTQSGEMLAPAVFVWHAVLLLDDGSTEKVKGDVTVLR